MNRNNFFRKNPLARLALWLATVGILAFVAPAQTTNATLDTTNAPEAVASPSNAIPVLQIKADQATAKVSPMLYGLMTEEINYSYEGGLYGELVRNRTFKANPTNAVFWSAIGNAVISLDTNSPLNAALNVSLKLDTRKAAKNSPAASPMAVTGEFPSNRIRLITRRFTPGARVSPGR